LSNKGSEPKKTIGYIISERANIYDVFNSRERAMAYDISKLVSEPGIVISHEGGASHVPGFFKAWERAIIGDFSRITSEPTWMIVQ
jgi:hypothetical protein